MNTRYKFYEELDLDKDDGKYLSPKADRNVINKYKLHSVLVHSGGVHGGHYFAFIRPDGHTWLKFDDDKVRKARDILLHAASALPLAICFLPDCAMRCPS